MNNIKKFSSQTLFAGAISDSVNLANSTVIDMTYYTGGNLDFKINSGTGTFSLAIFGCDTADGTFKQLYQEKYDKSGTEAKPPIVTTSTVSACYTVSGLTAKFIKFVPTITGTVNATFKFTPNA